MLNVDLGSEQLAFFRAHQYLVLKRPFTEASLADLVAWTDALHGWPETPGKWMKYFERSRLSGERMLCRVEDFIPHHAGFAELIRGARTMALLSALMGEEACLFKEKVNFKLPGGAGFAAHQDAPAFTTFDQRYHITLLIAVDPQTRENGCLELSDPVPVYSTLAQAADGTIAADIEARIPWRPLELERGDVVLFDSYLPHRSRPNLSQIPRRALYVTYNRLREGYRREDYFAAKRASFPPECERLPGVDYSAGTAIYNLGNPIQ